MNTTTTKQPRERGAAMIEYALLIALLVLTGAGINKMLNSSVDCTKAVNHDHPACNQ